MIEVVRRGLWIVGTPPRVALLAVVRIYRATLSGVLGGRCRFYPSCSSYAEQAIRELGAVRGLALTVWRVLRCSPLSRGGVDHPPRSGRRTATGPLYDNAIQGTSPADGGARQDAVA
jgi:putative membrane protein insertion efficiency factor